MRETLEQHHLHKFVVFHDAQFVDSFDSFHNAACEAVRRFGRGPYLIRQVGAPRRMAMPASVMGGLDSVRTRPEGQTATRRTLEVRAMATRKLKEDLIGGASNMSHDHDEKAPAPQAKRPFDFNDLPRVRPKFFPTPDDPPGEAAQEKPAPAQPGETVPLRSRCGKRARNPDSTCGRSTTPSSTSTCTGFRPVAVSLPTCTSTYASSFRPSTTGSGSAKNHMPSRGSRPWGSAP